MSTGPSHRPAFLHLRPLAPAASEAPASARHGLSVAARTPAEAAHGALRDALRELCEPCGGGPSRAGAPSRGPAAGWTPVLEPDTWAEEGGPLGRLHAGGRRLSARERGAWEAHAFGRDRVHEAAGAYARALRRDGVGLPAAIAAVRATLVRDAALLPPAVFAAVHREAVQCCLEAFYAH